MLDRSFLICHQHLPTDYSYYLFSRKLLLQVVEKFAIINKMLPQFLIVSTLCTVFHVWA